MNKRIRYRIYGIVDFEVEDAEITNVLEHIRGWGAAEVVDVELVVNDDAELPNVILDFATRRETATSG